jgi:maltooligosyltrehalose trehalohydrolase
MFRPDALGAVPFGSGTRFSLWALGHDAAAVEIEGVGTFNLDPVGGGYFSAEIPNVGVGARYWFRIDNGPRVPDLASRCQPEGNDGPSVVVASDFAWSDAGWGGVERRDQVLYE